MSKFSQDPSDQEAIDVLNTKALYVGMIKTTCVATRLRAGHGDNALAQSATATVNCRLFPGTEPEEVRLKLQSVAGNQVVVTITEQVLAGPASELRTDLVQAISQIVHAIHPKVRIIPNMVPWTTDGSVLRAHGIPTYGVAGLFIREEDSFAHGLNERIAVKSFYHALEHWYLLLQQQLAGSE